jgi:membrane-associated phospholipid phosphatase
LVGRDRPNEPEDKGRPNSGDLNGPRSKKDGSFPSGHTAGAFSVASVVAAEYRDTPGVGAAFYAAASLTALARVNDNEHWATDVVAGAALGTGIGMLVYRFRPWREGETVSFAPGAGDRPTGLTMNLRF